MSISQTLNLALLIAEAAAFDYGIVNEYPAYDELFYPNMKRKGMIFAEMNGSELEARENEERLRGARELETRLTHNVVRVPYLKVKHARLRRTPRVYSLAASTPSQSAPSLDSFTKAELVNMAREAGVSGRSKMNKAQLYAAIYG